MCDATQNVPNTPRPIYSLSNDELSRYLDPATDPAGVLPQSAVGSPRKDAPLSSLPSVEDIEKALNDHVRGGTPPIEMIQNLLHPFVFNPHQITLEPGKGKVRPNYALMISPFNLSIPRSSTRVVAEKLYEIADNLINYEIGDRAPEGALTYKIQYEEFSYHFSDIHIPARDHETLRQAYTSTFGRSPFSLGLKLEMTAKDLIPHVLAARKILTQSEVEAPEFRQQAIDLIVATEDLRVAVTVTLRHIPDISRYANYYITIDPHKPNKVSISNNREEDPQSSHEKILHAARYRALIEAVNDVLARHPVLSELPEEYEFHFNGEPNFLTPELVNTEIPFGSLERVISLHQLEYSEVTELALRLSEMRSKTTPPDIYWHLSLYGSLRSSGSWHLCGPTLAHALVNKFTQSKKQASMLITDLLIDLQGRSYGDPIEVDLSRFL